MKNIMRARKGGFTLVELLIVIMIIAILAGMMLLATGSATDSAEATKIINDLRSLKSAALLYFIDNGSWPASEDDGVDSDLTGRLNKYMDRDLEHRYGDLVVLVSKDAGVVTGVYYGFNADELSDIFTSGVRSKLASNAKTTGLYGDDGDDFESGDEAVYMLIK